MDILGIKFVPWNAPLKERLEILGASAFVLQVIVLSSMGPLLIYYITVHTQYWILGVIYLIWLYAFDISTPEMGGRRCEWIRSWQLWKYNRDYFPITLTKIDEVNLDPKRNYLFAIFPHGLFGSGMTNAFGSNACNFATLFPCHKSHLIVLHPHFYIPIYRDIMLSWGFCSSSAESLDFLLGNPNGGNVAALSVGGVAEQMNAYSGSYKLVVKERKGFIKLALRNGSPVVPVFSFGETSTYTLLPNPKGSWWRNIQEWSRQTTSFIPLIFNGRGLLQASFGLIPKQTPINVVVGKPIDVTKVENPTTEEVDALHSKFIEELIKLFEENKHKYEKDPKIRIVIT